MKIKAFCRGMLVVLVVGGSMVGCDGDDDEVAELKKELATLTTRVQQLESEVAALSGGVNLTTLRSDVDTLETNYAAHGTRLDTLEGTATSHGTRLDALEGTVSGMSGYATRLTDLETKTAAMSATEVEGKAAVVFTAVNVFIQNGEGDTETTNGTGNLIMGYNESPLTNPTRTGSHNLVVGIDHEYTSYAGLVAGEDNTVSAPYASVVGGGGILLAV
jgi:hypothetical protein